MANEDDLKAICQGAEYWNEYFKGLDRSAILRMADLSGADLRGAILVGVDLRGAKLGEALLSGADLREAFLRGAGLNGADLCGAILRMADLSETDLRGANLVEADLSGADLGEALLSGADFRGANLRGANLRDSFLIGTRLVDTLLEKAVFERATFIDTVVRADMTSVIGLDTVNHFGPSFIDINSILNSSVDLPEKFLRGCGLPDALIENIRSLKSAGQPIQYNSCFISYSHEDEEFAQRLHARMQQEHLRVWYAPEDMKAGQKIHEQIDRAIQLHDRLLLIISADSMKSSWVEREIRKARIRERKENRRILFPISLTEFSNIETWELFDADEGRDLAAEIREYFIPDFTAWKNHDEFEKSFNRFLDDLKKEDE